MRSSCVRLSEIDGTLDMQEKDITEIEGRLEGRALKRKASVLNKAYQTVGMSLIPLAIGLLAGLQLFEPKRYMDQWPAWLLVAIGSVALHFLVRLRQRDPDGVWLLYAFTLSLGLLLTPLVLIAAYFLPSFPLQAVLTICAGAAGCMVMSQVVERHGIGKFHVVAYTVAAAAPVVYLLMIGAAYLMHPDAGVAGAIALATKQLMQPLAGPLLPLVMLLLLLFAVGSILNFRIVEKDERFPTVVALDFYNSFIGSPWSRISGIVLVGGAAYGASQAMRNASLPSASDISDRLKD